MSPEPTVSGSSRLRFVLDNQLVLRRLGHAPTYGDVARALDDLPAHLQDGLIAIDLNLKIPKPNPRARRS